MDPTAAEGSGSPPESPPAEPPVTVEQVDEGFTEADDEPIDVVPTDDEIVATDIRSEGSQGFFDQNVVIETLRGVRQSLANAKLNYQMAAAGLIDAPKGAGVHPEQFKREVQRLEKIIELLVGFTDGGQVELPGPPNIEIASSLPGR